jgi:hypothetical protein
MLNETQTEKLIERITDLLANDEQFSAALPVEEVAKAMLSREHRPGGAPAGGGRGLCRPACARPPGH